MTRSLLTQKLITRLKVVMLAFTVIWRADCVAELAFAGSFEGHTVEISGLFTGVFDDSVVPPGHTGEFEVPLVSFELNSNPFIDTLFGLNSVGATLIYNEGILTVLGVGGYTQLNSTRAIWITHGVDDFAVCYEVEPTPLITQVTVTQAGLPWTAVDETPHGSLLVNVPEPGVVRLLLCSLCTLLLLARQRPRRTKATDRTAYPPRSGGWS